MYSYSIIIICPYVLPSRRLIKFPLNKHHPSKTIQLCLLSNFIENIWWKLWSLMLYTLEKLGLSYLNFTLVLLYWNILFPPYKTTLYIGVYFSQQINLIFYRSFSINKENICSKVLRHYQYYIIALGQKCWLMRVTKMCLKFCF